MVLGFYFWSMGELLPIGHMVFEKISSFGLFGGAWQLFFQYIDTKILLYRHVKGFINKRSVWSKCCVELGWDRIDIAFST